MIHNVRRMYIFYHSDGMQGPKGDMGMMGPKGDKGIKGAPGSNADDPGMIGSTYVRWGRDKCPDTAHMVYQGKELNLLWQSFE